MKNRGWEEGKPPPIARARNHDVIPIMRGIMKSNDEMTGEIARLLDLNEKDVDQLKT